MKNVDYIVVGLGIAGITFCEQLERGNKSFKVIDREEEGATSRSGGIFNPTILKRFTAAWNASTFYPVAVGFYQGLSKKLNKEIFQETPILRILNNTEEQNNWVVASEKIGLRNHLQTDLVKNTNSNISAPFGFGKLLGTARIKKDELLSSYKNKLISKDFLIKEQFEYDKLQVRNDGVAYKGLSARKVVFCEGPGALQNPFLLKEAIIPNKGEYLLIRAPNLKLDEMLKGPIYIIPLGGDLYKIGATYVRDQSSSELTLDAREELLSKLKRMIKCSIQVIDQTAGIRPTTHDRKPLLGHLNGSPNLIFFNGLGTHGLLMAPYLSKVLYDNLEEGIPIPAEMDIRRVL